jgi:kanamycin kinase
MTFPSGPVPVPAVVAGIAAGRAIDPVWVNELDGVTFRIGGPVGAATDYVKTGPGDFAAERARLDWAGRYLTVPRVLGGGPGWLHTAALPAWSAVDARWREDPGVAARAAGAGLRIMHDRLPVQSCPFDWSVQKRLAGVVADARPPLRDAPAVDRLVVCHGDACTPNTLMDAGGSFYGHVDLGSLGVADRWADLAVATMSLDWNFPPADDAERGTSDEEAGNQTGDWEAVLLAAYGIDPDPVRLDYYRRLWDAPEVGDG